MKGSARSIARDLARTTEAGHGALVVTARELADLLGWCRNTILAAVARLVRAGLIRRTGQNRTKLVWNLSRIAELAGVSIGEQREADELGPDRSLSPDPIEIAQGLADPHQRNTIAAFADGMAIERAAELEREARRNNKPIALEGLVDSLRPLLPDQPRQARIYALCERLSRELDEAGPKVARLAGSAYIRTQRGSLIVSKNHPLNGQWLEHAWDSIRVSVLETIASERRARANAVPVAQTPLAAVHHEPVPRSVGLAGLLAKLTGG